MSGQLAANQSRQYVLRASRGQIMQVVVWAPAGARLRIWGADGASLKEGAAGDLGWQGTLPKTQDYYVEVASSGQALSYCLRTTVFARIQFARGAVSGTVSGHLAAGSPARYILWAARGQRMEIRIWPAPGRSALPALSVAVAGPSGRTWSGLGLDSAIEPLPASGDYVITLALQPGSPATNFIMEVTIPAR